MLGIYEMTDWQESVQNSIIQLKKRVTIFLNYHYLSQHLIKNLKSLLLKNGSWKLKTSLHQENV